MYRLLGDSVLGELRPNRETDREKEGRSDAVSEIGQGYSACDWDKRGAERNRTESEWTFQPRVRTPTGETGVATTAALPARRRCGVS